MPETLRLLLCSHNPLTRHLGAPKVLIELAEALVPFGWQVEFVSPPDLGMETLVHMGDHRSFSENLGAHLRQHAGEFDVIDYDHGYLPFRRQEFSLRTLMVARSVLLIQHFQSIQIPNRPGLRSLASRVLRGRRRRRDRDERACVATQTIQQADLVNVCNEHDKTELIRRNIDQSKIAVIPFGMSRSRHQSFEAIREAVPVEPIVAFVGTFDYRKGAREFPEIVRRLCEQIPSVKFKLLGTQGQFRGAEQILRFFPPQFRSRLEVQPTFGADQLAGLLSGCSMGIFPSHVEGFPFGVLEMLAAALPVIAYDAPGPPMMLPPEWLVPRGDGPALARKVGNLLQDVAALALARRRARELAARFTWEAAAGLTDVCYRAALARRRLQ